MDGPRRQLPAAAIALVILVVACYAAFVRTNPFTSQFTLHGVFATSSQLQPGNPVRLDGVTIGQVTRVTSGPRNTSVVAMSLSSKTSLLHRDATLAIKPRLLFEGNFYVEVTAGTPGAPALRSGATVPLSRTQIPVQFDQALDVLSAPIRQALTGEQSSLANGLGGPGQSGYDGLRGAVRELDQALPSVGVAAGALQGTQPGDLTRAVASTGEFTNELSTDPPALGRLVTEFNRTLGALAANDVALGRGIRELDTVMQDAPPSLSAIDSALPSLTAFTDQLRPALHVAPVSLTQTNGLLRQLDALAAPDQVPALVSALRPVTTDLPPLVNPLANGLTLLSHAARCIVHPVVPALKTVIPDGHNTTGYPIWLDIIHAGAALLGSSAGFDADGGTLRLGLSEGVNAVRELLPGLGQVVGYGDIEGDNPEWLGARVPPPFRPDVWCETQPVPDYGARNFNGVPAGMQVGPSSAPAPQLTARLASELKLFLGGTTDRIKLLKELISRSATQPRPASAKGRLATSGVSAGAREAPASKSSPQPAATSAAGTGQRSGSGLPQMLGGLGAGTNGGSDPSAGGGHSPSPSPPAANRCGGLAAVLATLTGQACASAGGR
jgi:phospholipid/cholesterol/gamma-HCH transport system substrate-binding protein